MMIGYARVSKADGSQKLDLQMDALKEAGVTPCCVYQDQATGKHDKRPGLQNCLKALRQGDTLVVWKLDRLGRSLKDLVKMIADLTDRGIDLKILAGQGANLDTSTPSGKLMLGMFAVLAEFEHDLIKERINAGLAAARKRGIKGGRPAAVNRHQLVLIQKAMTDRDTCVGELCKQFGISRQTVYRYVSPEGELRPQGLAVMKKTAKG